MHIARRSNQELVIVDSSIWLSLPLLCGFVVILYRLVPIHARLVDYLGAAFLLLFALVFWRKEVVVFDAGRQQAEWTRRRLFRLATGTIPFSEISGIGMETTSAKNNVLVYRLTILTTHGSVPMADNYAGDRQKYEKLKREILEFLHLDAGDANSAAGSSGIDDEASVRSLLEQGRRIDAIQLVRSTQKIGLAEATDRVAAIYEQMKAVK